MPRIILHVDMDAFYSSVEKRENPALKGLPVIVGSDPKGGKGRGVVAGCSYEARKFGIYSGQPISQAFRLCPNAVYLRPNFDLYERVSEKIMSILRRFSEKLEPVGIDEAFLDISSEVKNFEEARQLALRIKDTIATEEKLSCSVGVAPSKSVAKIASDFQKPDGLTIIEPERVIAFLKPLSVSRISGIGRKTEEKLRALGIETIGQLAAQSRARMADLFGKYGVWMWQISNGIDEEEVRSRERIKSMSTEKTFDEDVGDRGLVMREIEAMAREIHTRLKDQEYFFKSVGIKIRFEDFSTFTRSHSIPEYTGSLDVIIETARKLLAEFETDKRKIRLIGVKLSNLRKMDRSQETLLSWARSEFKS
jgi:DNA polymerase IV (DinB-like DNA polymerase)